MSIPIQKLHEISTVFTGIPAKKYYKSSLPNAVQANLITSDGIDQNGDVILEKLIPVWHEDTLPNKFL